MLKGNRENLCPFEVINFHCKENNGKPKWFRYVIFKFLISFADMKWLLILLCIVFLSSCSDNQIPFQKSGWMEKKDFLYTKRSLMMDDLTGNHKLTGIKTNALFELLGPPDNGDERKFSYTIVVELGNESKSTYLKSLIFEVGADSVVQSYRVEEFQQ